jgi:hypothetical protein
MSASLEAKARVRQDQQDYQEFCISKPKIKNRVDPVNPVGNALFWRFPVFVLSWWVWFL